MMGNTFIDVIDDGEYIYRTGKSFIFFNSQIPTMGRNRAFIAIEHKQKDIYMYM